MESLVEQFPLDPKLLPKLRKPGEDARVECVWPAFIGLLGARVGATILDRDNQLINKLIDQGSVLVGKVVFFSRVVFKIIKLQQVKILVLQCLSRARVTPATGTGTEDEFPVTAPDGKGTINGVMNRKGPQRLFDGLTQKNRQKGKGVLPGSGRDHASCMPMIGSWESRRRSTGW